MTATRLPQFVSQQVTEARRFFLNLNPNRKAPLAVVCGGVERMRADYVVERSAFSYLAIELVAEGQGELTIDGVKHALTAGSVFAYGQRTQHRIVNHAGNGMRKYYVDFVGTRARQLLRDCGLRSTANEYQVLSLTALHELTEVFELLIREGSGGDETAHRICESLTQLLMQKIRQRRLQHGRQLPISYATFEHIRQYIDRNFLELRTAREIAHACSVTPVYVSRIFSRYAPCGAYQYLMRRKMNYAAGLIMNEGLLVKEVANRLGFTDAFQFSRAFKRVYGVPPSEVAANVQRREMEG